MTTDEIQKLIEAGVPDSKAMVSGGEGKYEAIVISESFADLSMVKEHQMVYATVKPQIASGELHALSIKAFTPEEWEKEQSK
ncbi:MAG: BolA/IbaG family iron-sulfur metabolism protein [Gammaproteobacteria bacterium]|nr:BolA/IbaG family iron-sulfur metabolism protein [Gammaproteobacteria bacterium]NNC68056.1 BolA/IbaG family iron-sulfur metabolism protein [Gammaproteobacteria bacterium]